jgi:hypothetical protein
MRRDIKSHNLPIVRDLELIRDESAEAERLLLRIPEQRQVDPTYETEDREIGRLVAFGDRLDDPRRQEAQPQGERIERSFAHLYDNLAKAAA